MNSSFRRAITLNLSEQMRAQAFDLSPEPALVIGPMGELAAANEAAEALFGQGLGLIARGRFRDALPPNSTLVRLIDRALDEGSMVRERGVEINLYGQPPFDADASAAPMGDGSVLIHLHVRSGGLNLERVGDGAGLRSVIGLGLMLDHEINNPQAGIRRAEQLLKTGEADEYVPQAQLIVDETDRVRRLVDRMEAFSDDAAPVREPVNIHQVLDRIRTLAANGFADGLAVKEAYDPSLPPTYGDED
jgi:two-component system nitrogen regulation sensor histidine kinase GlnL